MGNGRPVVEAPFTVELFAERFWPRSGGIGRWRNRPGSPEYLPRPSAPPELITLD